MEIVLIVLAAGGLILASVALSTWLLMLVLGWVHSFADFVPALGFWQTLAVVILLYIVGGFFKGASSS